MLLVLVPMWVVCPPFYVCHSYSSKVTSWLLDEVQVTQRPFQALTKPTLRYSRGSHHLWTSITCELTFVWPQSYSQLCVSACSRLATAAPCMAESGPVLYGAWLDAHTAERPGRCQNQRKSVQSVTSRLQHRT
eukprot:scaffold91544_cov22-Prasinocladus_malaysianus.AAC.1